MNTDHNYVEEKLDNLQRNNAESHVQMREQIRKLQHRVDYLTIWVITLTILLLYFQFA